MKLQITIYLSLTLVVFGVGYALFVSFIKDASPEREPSPVTNRQETDASKPVKSQSLLVESVNGLVERSNISRDTWTKVVPGNELFADERLRTDTNATVKLQADDRSQIELDGRTEISIQEITDTVHRIKLELGKLDVDYKESDKRRLKITTTAKDRFAESEAGRFVIQNSSGKLSVATTAGNVALTGNNETISVGPGKLSYILEGKSPTKPEPIPLEVMLRVANPAKRRQAERSTTVRGRTDISARVLVNDLPAEVDDNGRFNVQVPLERGRNRIQVLASTTYGTAEKGLPTILVTDSVYTNHTTAPAAVDSAEVRWGKKKQRRKAKAPHAKDK